MSIKKVTWLGKEWKTRFQWGWFHPGGDFHWFDSDQVKVLDSGEVELYVSPNPREFNGVTIPNGSGMIESELHYGYGEYSADIKLPQGKNVFPAFWLTAVETWPPEIDIMEHWSNTDSFWDKIRLKKFWVKTGIYAGESPDSVIGIKKPKVFPASKLWPVNGWTFLWGKRKKFINYKLRWERGKAEVFMDGKKVYTADERIKHSSFLKDPKMTVIFNVWTHKKEARMDSPMVVKNFKYSPI